MHLVLIFILLCAGAVSISLIFNKRIEETLSLWIFVIILILYLFGISGLLKVGIYTIISIASISIFFCCYSFYRNKQNFITNVLTPGFAMFIAFFVLAWWAQKGRMLTTWDEFSHWGLVVKNMYIFDALGNYPDATTLFRGYPPATALFEYLWVKLSGSFSEYNLYRAMNILYFSLMLPIFKNLKWRDYGKIISRTILVLILPLVFYPDFYTSLLVDPILGIMFAYVLINYFANELSTYTIINISFALFILALTKASGSALAIMAIIVIVIDLLFIKRQDLNQYINQNRKIDNIKRMIILSCPIFFTLISKYSWSLYLSLTNTKVAWDTSKIGFQSLKNLFTGNAQQYQRETIMNFFNFLSNSFLTDYTLKISYIGWIILLISISIMLITFICNKAEKGRFKVATIIIFIGAGIYTFSLLILYVFTYTDYEAVRLASCARYLDTYLLGTLIFFVVTICLKEQVDDAKSEILYSISILLVLLLITKITPIANITLLAPLNIKSSIAVRAPYDPITKIKQVLNPKTDKLYFISIADNGLDYYVSRYDITPIKTNAAGSWSLGKPYYEGDIWTKDIDVDKWAEELKNEYTYVYIFKTNDPFTHNYGKIFDGGSKAIQNNTLYYVNKNNDRIILEKVK